MLKMTLVIIIKSHCSILSHGSYFYYLQFGHASVKIANNCSVESSKAGKDVLVLQNYQQKYYGNCFNIYGKNTLLFA